MSGPTPHAPRSSRAVRITEVGPRDGLQNEQGFVATEDKIRFIDLLSSAGFPEIEVTSFVSPRWIPQLRDAEDVLSGIARRPGTIYSALVPNERGLDRAIAARADKVAIFVAASETFSHRNINASIDESMQRLRPVARAAVAAGLPVRAYVSCVVTCPYEGPVAPVAVARVVERLLEVDVQEIDLGDTTGAAGPTEIIQLYAGLSALIKPSATTLHLHDTGGQALSCASQAIALGVRSFDASCAGLGGCPYAPGAPGNVATESLVAHLTREGFDCGIDPSPLAEAGRLIRSVLRTPMDRSVPEAQR